VFVIILIAAFAEPAWQVCSAILVPTKRGQQPGEHNKQMIALSHHVITATMHENGGLNDRTHAGQIPAS
jgi:hypothetical protein